MEPVPLPDQMTAPTPPASTDALVSSVKSATRVLDLLECLGRWGREKTHTEIAAELNIPKSSLTQLIRTLVGRGYLAYVPATKGYRLGEAVRRLAQGETETADLLEAAPPVLSWMARETGESCALNIMSGDESQVAASAAGSHRLNITMRDGDRAPLYATSGGKALLAQLPDPLLEAYYARVRFDPITTQTISSVERLREEIAQVRASGFAHVIEEYTPGITGVACAVRSTSEHAVCSLNIATPVTRYNERSLRLCEATLSQAAKMLRSKLRG